MSLKRNPVEHSNYPNKLAKLSRAELIQEIANLVEPNEEQPYFKAICEQVDGLYSIYEEAISSISQLAQKLQNLAIDAATQLKDKEIDKQKDMYKGLIVECIKSTVEYIKYKGWSKQMEELASNLAAIENSDQPIPEIQKLVEGDEWQKWRTTFSTENMQNVLKMTTGKQSKGFLKARLFSFAAYRMGLSVVNPKNGLRDDQPPPFMNNAPYHKDGENETYIYESMLWTLLGLLAGHLKTTDQYNTDQSYKKIIDDLKHKSKKSIDLLKEKWDRVINRKMNMTEGDSAVTLWGKHKQTYKAQLGDELSQVVDPNEFSQVVDPNEFSQVSFLPPRRLNYSKSGMFNPFKEPPTNLEFDGAKIVIRKGEWSGLISSFYDPVMFWIDDKIKEAKASDLKLQQLLMIGKADNYEVSKTRAQIEEQLKEAKAFDPSFYVEDRQEAERRLSLYETYSLWDTMIQALEKIFVAEKKYNIASYTYDLFYYGTVNPNADRAPQIKNGAIFNLKKLLDENTVEEIVKKYENKKYEEKTNVTTEQINLYNNRSKADEMVEQRKNEYGIHLQQNRQFLACAEIASRLLRLRIATSAKDDPHAMAYSGTSAVQTPEIESSIKRTAALFRKPFTERLRLAPCPVPRSATSVSRTCRQTTARVPRQAVPPPPPQDLVCVLNARFALLGV